MEEKKKMGKGKKIILWLGAIIFIGGIIGQLSDSDTNTPAEPKTAEKQQAEKAEKDKKEDAKKEEQKEQKKEEVKKKDTEKKEEPKKKEGKKPTANMEGYEDRVAELIKDSEGIILDIRPNPYAESYQQMEIVIDGNIWEVSSETDKINFAEAIANAVENALVGYSVIEPSSTVTFTILDQNDYELAKRGVFSGKFKIKR